MKRNGMLRQGLLATLALGMLGSALSMPAFADGDKGKDGKVPIIIAPPIITQDPPAPPPKKKS